MLKKLILSLCASIVLVAAPLKSLPQNANSFWPKNTGIYLATSSKAIPSFPRIFAGFRSANGKDFWGNEFALTGSVRIFEGGGWTGIPDFPNTMNNCSSGVFMIRWRVANSDVRVASTLGYSPDSITAKSKTGGYGYMTGTNCDQPLFKFNGTLNGNESNLADVYYELEFWQAAP